MSFHVSIIGKGLSGLFLAYELIRKGVKSEVFYSSYPEASKASQGVVASKGLINPESRLFELKLLGQRYTFKKLKELKDLGLSLTISEGVFEGYSSYEEYFKICQRIYRGEYRGLFNISSSSKNQKIFKYFGSLYYPDDYWVDVPELLESLKSYLKSKGVIFSKRNLSKVDLRNLSKGAKKIVLACGYGSTFLLSGIDLRTKILPASGSTMKFSYKNDKNKSFVFGGNSVNLGINSALLGSSSFKKEWCLTDLSQSKEYLTQAALRFGFDDLDVNGIELISGTRCLTSDRLPLVGKSHSPDFCDNLFISTGFFKNGLMLIPICSDFLSDLILDRNLSPFFSSLKIDLHP